MRQLTDRDRDICFCGDFRHQHDGRGCIICRSIPPAWGRCERFILDVPYDGVTWRPGKNLADLRQLKCKATYGGS